MSISKRLRFEIFKRDRFTCRYCGAQAPDVELHIDHVIPRSKGGSDLPENLCTACSACNLAKAAVPLEQRVLEHVSEDEAAHLKEMRADADDARDYQLFLEDPYIASLYGEPIV